MTKFHRDAFMKEPELSLESGTPLPGLEGAHEGLLADVEVLDSDGGSDVAVVPTQPSDYTVTEALKLHADVEENFRDSIAEYTGISPAFVDTFLKRHHIDFSMALTFPADVLRKLLDDAAISDLNDREPGDSRFVR